MVTAGKHVNITQIIVRQLLGKRVPAAVNTHAAVEVLLVYKNGNGVFYGVRAEMLYSGSAEFRSSIGSCQQFI
jgi:hypothetical protein